MAIPEEKAARIQELLQKLSTSGVYEGVSIAAEIHKVAAEPTRVIGIPIPRGDAAPEIKEKAAGAAR